MCEIPLLGGYKRPVLLLLFVIFQENLSLIRGYWPPGSREPWKSMKMMVLGGHFRGFWGGHFGVIFGVKIKVFPTPGELSGL